MTGYTHSANFPIVGTSTAFGGASFDAFVTKIGTSGAELSYSTYLGGSNNDAGNGIAVDSAGNAYVTGWTYSTDFPIVGTTTAYGGGGSDAFVTKIAEPLTEPTPTPSPTPETSPTPESSPTPVITPTPQPSPTGTPTAITLLSFTVKAGNNGKVTLAWQTGTEIDNAGFNIYRARKKDGNYKKINDLLILANGNATTGADYSYTDTPPAKGKYFYKLEDVDYSGVSTMHGPVKVKAKAPHRAKGKKQK